MHTRLLAADDALLLRRFRDRQFGPDAWTHAMHLRVGWMHLRLFGDREAMQRLRMGITRLNEANGVVNGPDSGYHETLTRLWLDLLHVRDANDVPPAACSAEFLERHPDLLDKELPLRFYTRERLFGAEARAAWIPPDLDDPR